MLYYIKKYIMRKKLLSKETNKIFIQKVESGILSGDHDLNEN